MRVLFGQLQTDQPDLLNGELEEAENCIPFVQSYGPFPAAAAYSQAAPAKVYGAMSTKDLGNNVYTFLGTEKALYRESATAINDISRTATYAASTETGWEFVTFGNTVLGVNGFDAMQVFTMGTSTQFRNQSASASAPVAAHIAVVRDFVMVGKLSNLTNRVQWSRINNPLRFDVSQRYQSDFQDLPGTNQNIRRITGGDFAAIFTQNSVWRATYVGSPLIFRFDEVAPNVGCYAGGSVARFQNVSFFLSDSGFYAFDGTNAIPIGIEQVDETVLSEINKSYLNNIKATVDPVNRLYVMIYPSNDSTDGICDRMAIYSWDVKRWSFASETLEYIFQHMTPGFTLEDLDAFVTMETLPFSLDSELWQRGLPSLSGINELHRICRFEGPAKTAHFTTGESQIIQDARAFVRSVRPLVQGNSATSITVEIGKRDRLIDPVVWEAPSPMNATGHCPVRANARYHRMKMTVAGGFERVMGGDIDFTKEGRR